MMAFHIRSVTGTLCVHYAHSVLLLFKSALWFRSSHFKLSAGKESCGDGSAESSGGLQPQLGGLPHIEAHPNSSFCLFPMGIYTMPRPGLITTQFSRRLLYPTLDN